MSNTYYIRTADKDTLLALAVQIGLLRVTEDGQQVMADPHAGIWDPIGPIHKPTGNTVTQTMSTPELALVQTPGPMDTVIETWEPTGNMLTSTMDVPEMAPITDDSGAPYWHANLQLYELSLGDMAREAYAANASPELGAALASIPSYFVADAEGAPVAPAMPARSFA